MPLLGTPPPTGTDSPDSDTAGRSQRGEGSRLHWGTLSHQRHSLGEGAAIVTGGALLLPGNAALSALEAHRWDQAIPGDHPTPPFPIPSTSPLQLLWQQEPDSGWAQGAGGQARGWQWAWPSRHWHSWQGSRGWEKLSPSTNTCSSRMQSEHGAGEGAQWGLRCRPIDPWSPEPPGQGQEEAPWREWRRGPCRRAWVSL